MKYLNAGVDILTPPDQRGGVRGVEEHIINQILSARGSLRTILLPEPHNASAEILPEDTPTLRPPLYLYAGVTL